MTTEDKLLKLRKLADAMYYAAQYLTTDASRLHKAMDEYHKFIIHEWREEPVSESLEKAATKYAQDKYMPVQTSQAFKAGAQWQKTKDESTTEDLGEYINELSKQFPEVSFAKLSRIAVRVAKWQKEQFEKDYTDLYNGIATAKGIAVAMAYDKGMADAREQMMAEAIDGDITFDYYGDDDKTYGCIAHDSFCLEDFGLKDRDKVKVIVIKED